MRYLEEIDLKQIKEEYEKGISLEEIAKKLNLPVRIIKSELLAYGRENGKEILLKELERKYPMIKEMVEDCKQGKTIKQFFERYQIDIEKIYEGIRLYQLITGEKFTIRNKHGSGNIREDLQVDKIIEQFRKGKTLAEIAEEQEASVTAVRNRLKQYIQKHGNEIEEEHNKAIEKLKNKKKKQQNQCERIDKYDKTYVEEVKDRYISTQMTDINNKNEKGEER